MALIVCKSCRRAFINGPRNEVVCPECEAKLREIYPVVRNFLRNNEPRLYSAQEVCNILDVSIKDIDGLISMGLIGVDNPSADKTQARPKTPIVSVYNPNAASSSDMHVYNKKRKKETPGKE